MRLLLDTHAFIWWVTGDRRLSARATDAIRDPASEVVLSVVCVWEIVVKTALGRLAFVEDPARALPAYVGQGGFDVLPLKLSHALGLLELPDHHRDPFDRMLVAQARAESLAIVSGDTRIARYPVEVLW